MVFDANSPWTVEAMLALPDEGFHRTLLRGVLCESSERWRPWQSAQTFVRLSTLLLNWRDQLVGSDIKIGGGLFRFEQAPDSAFEIDIAILPTIEAEKLSRKSRFVEGQPIVAVQILRDDDMRTTTLQELERCIAAGSALGWMVDPFTQTVTAIEPHRTPTVYADDQTLTAEPHLPGFAVPMSRLWE